MSVKTARRLSQPMTAWQWLNALLIALALIAWTAITLSALLAEREPFDYRILMDSAERYCYAPDSFQYGITRYPVAEDGREVLPQLSFYPATFYVAFCALAHHAPALNLLLWMLLPLVTAFMLSGGRAAILAYPPLFLLILLGQSTTWVMLMLVLIAHYEQGGKVRAWHGIAVASFFFKPHLAALGLLYLLWRWRKSPATLAVALGMALALLIPAFAYLPSWVGEWLAQGRRGFEIGSMVSVAGWWVRMFNLPFAPSASVQLLVWGISAGVAVGLLGLAYWRRGKLEFYDWLLVLCLTLPLIHDYDLVILLPFIALRPRLLLVALVCGALAWLFAMFSRQPDGLGMFSACWTMSFMLYAVRLLKVQDADLMCLRPARLGKAI